MKDIRSKHLAYLYQIIETSKDPYQRQTAEKFAQEYEDACVEIQSERSGNAD